MKRAVIYIRASTADQTSTLEVQEERAKDFCIYHDIEIISILVDSDVSGGMPIYKRENGSKIKRLIECGEINCIVSNKLDRIFRSTIDALVTVEEWNNQNIGLNIIDVGGANSLDTSSAVGKLIFTFLVAQHQFEREISGERTKAVLNHKKANNKAYSKTPFGFDRVGDDLIVNESEQKAIELIFSLKEQKYSLSEIASELTRKQIKSKKGGYWQRSSIQSILSNSSHKKAA